MTASLSTIAALGTLEIAALWLAYHLGRKASQLKECRENARKQERETAHAQEIRTAVYGLSMDDARRRLHDVANKQR